MSFIKGFEKTAAPLINAPGPKTSAVGAAVAKPTAPQLPSIPQAWNKMMANKGPQQQSPVPVATSMQQLNSKPGAALPPVPTAVAANAPIPTAGSKAPTAASPTAAAKPSAQPYQIQKGDTLSQIAQRQGTSVDALMKANPQIKDPNKIYAGRNLNLTGTPGAQPSAPRQVAGAKPAGAAKGGGLFDLSGMNAQVMAGVKNMPSGIGSPAPAAAPAAASPSTSMMNPIERRMSRFNAEATPAATPAAQPAQQATSAQQEPRAAFNRSMSRVPGTGTLTGTAINTDTGKKYNAVEHTSAAQNLSAGMQARAAQQPRVQTGALAANFAPAPAQSPKMLAKR